MQAPLRKFSHFLTEERSPTPEVISFRATRRAVGWLGVSLPFVLWIGGALTTRCDLQPSISHYYYTNMREVFVGILCAVSLFLFTYKGHSKLDSYAANLAGIFALGVAIFPTDIIVGYGCQQPVRSIFSWGIHNTLHFSSAALFFVVLACMSLFLFTKSNKPKSEWSAPKRRRNKTYIVCGVVMLVCIVLIALSEPLFGSTKTSKITFAMETVALVFFGISWLTKGEVVFKDQKNKI